MNLFDETWKIWKIIGIFNIFRKKIDVKQRNMLCFRELLTYWVTKKIFVGSILFLYLFFFNYVRNQNGKDQENSELSWSVIDYLFSCYLFPLSHCFLHHSRILEIWIKEKNILNLTWSWGDTTYQISINDDCTTPRSNKWFQMSWYQIFEFLIIDLGKTINNIMRYKRKKKEKNVKYLWNSASS